VVCGNKQEQKSVFGFFLCGFWWGERERERERKGSNVVSEHKEDRGRIVFFLEVSSMGIKQVQERERERKEKKKHGIKQREVTSYKEPMQKKCKK